MSIGSSHIPFAQVADLVEGRLSAAAQAEAQAHMAACSRCAAEINWLTYVIELMRADADKDDDPPAQVVDRAVSLFRARRAAGRLGVRQRLVAALHFDSWGPLHPLEVRGGARSERQLLFSAEGLDVDVRITGSGELWTVAGQLLAPASGGTVVLQGASGALQSALTELSEFNLSPVLPGVYTLIVQLAGVEVEIAGLEVGV